MQQSRSHQRVLAHRAESRYRYDVAHGGRVLDAQAYSGDSGLENTRWVATISRFVEKSRRFAIVAIAGTFLCVVGLLLVGFYQIYEAAISALDLGREGMSEMHFIVNVLEIMDTFLISTACFIITVGAYQLFIDRSISMPAWLTIRDFDDLKRRLAGVVVIILGLGFLADFVNWDGRTDLMREGLSVAVVVLALTAFIKVITPTDR